MPDSYVDYAAPVTDADNAYPLLRRALVAMTPPSPLVSDSVAAATCERALSPDALEATAAWVAANAHSLELVREAVRRRSLRIPPGAKSVGGEWDDLESSPLLLSSLLAASSRVHGADQPERAAADLAAALRLAGLRLQRPVDAWQHVGTWIGVQQAAVATCRLLKTPETIARLPAAQKAELCALWRDLEDPFTTLHRAIRADSLRWAVVHAHRAAQGDAHAKDDTSARARLLYERALALSKEPYETVAAEWEQVERDFRNLQAGHAPSFKAAYLAKRADALTRIRAICRSMVPEEH